MFLKHLEAKQNISSAGSGPLPAGCKLLPETFAPSLLGTTLLAKAAGLALFPTMAVSLGPQLDPCPVQGVTSTNFFTRWKFITHQLFKGRAG